MAIYLVPDNIRTVKVGNSSITIKEKIIPDTARATKDVASWCLTGEPMKPCRPLGYGANAGKPLAITIHNSSAISVNAATTMAEQYCRACYPNQNGAGAIVHYWVSGNDIWHQVRDDEQGWHAADGTSRTYLPNGSTSCGGNLDTIAIEIIESNEDQTTEATAAKLVAYLCSKYNLDPNYQVVTHNWWMYHKNETITYTIKRKTDGAEVYYCTGSLGTLNGYYYDAKTKLKYDTTNYTYGYPRKNCPNVILGHWGTFINNIKAYINDIKIAAIDNTSTTTTQVATATTTVLNTTDNYVGTIIGQASPLVFLKTLASNGFAISYSKAISDTTYGNTVYIGTAIGTNKALLEEVLTKTKAAGFYTYLSQMTDSKTNNMYKLVSTVDTTTKSTTTTNQGTATVTYKVNDKIRLLDTAVVYGTDRRFADFSYNRDLWITSISGTRAVFSAVGPGGAVTGAVDTKYIRKV